MATLTGRTISASYTELLKTTGSGGITSSLDTVQDGDATDSALQLSSAGIKSTGTLEVAGGSTLTGNVALGEDAVITFEGATDDAFETTLTTVDPTADRTVSLPNATDTLIGKDTTDTLTNKTLTSPALDTGVSGTAVLDSDTMSGASATTLATSESIKAYVDAVGDTTYTGGTNLTLDGTTFNVDDAFLKNDASDTTTGTITAGGFTTTGTLTLDSVGLSTVQTSAESFADNDTSVMTSAAVADKVEAYGYSTLTIGTSSSTALAGDTTTISSGQASAITANTSKTTNATHTGEVTGSAALTIANDVVDEANLKVDNAPTDDYVLTAKASATGGLTWAASGSSGQLTTFTVSATTDTTATTISQDDDLFFAAGTGITCETTADGTVTIANTVTNTDTKWDGGATGLTASTGRTSLGLVIGTDVMAHAANNAVLSATQAWTLPQRAALTTDDDGSFDLDAKQNFFCTPGTAVALTFANPADGQSGYVKLVNAGAYVHTAHANTKIHADDLTAIGAAGTFLLGYLSDGTDTWVTVSKALA